MNLNQDLLIRKMRVLTLHQLRNIARYCHQGMPEGVMIIRQCMAAIVPVLLSVILVFFSPLIEQNFFWVSPIIELNFEACVD